MAGGPRMTRKPRDPERTARIAAMIRDRANGMEYQAIADKHGYQTKQGAYVTIQKALAEMLQESIEELKIIERERLRILWAEAIRLMEQDHPILYQGEDTGYINVGAKLAAMDRAIRISERISKLEGLDAPTRHEVLSLDAIDAEIARLNRELAGRVASAQAAGTEGAAAEG